MLFKVLIHFLSVTYLIYYLTNGVNIKSEIPMVATNQYARFLLSVMVLKLIFIARGIRLLLACTLYFWRPAKMPLGRCTIASSPCAFIANVELTLMQDKDRLMSLLLERERLKF